jgi:beta-lactam-binding protein with PASTA domain
MVRLPLEIVKKGYAKAGKMTKVNVNKEVLDFGVEVGRFVLEKQKNLIKVPDLKDVYLDEAIHVLKDDLGLIPMPIESKPNLAYVESTQNAVVYSVPRFGSKVSPGEAIKIYYLTQEIINDSKKLLDKEVKESRLPRVIGLNVYEAREDLENLGLRVTVKLEHPNSKFVDLEDDQVTRVTYPNQKRIGSKVKTGERIWVYFVNEQVITESKTIKDNKGRVNYKKTDHELATSEDIPSKAPTEVNKEPKNIITKFRKKFSIKKARGKKNI